MPELPEVETIVRTLRQSDLVGRAIRKTFVGWRGTLARPSPEQFRRRLVGRRITRIGRRGKYIVLPLSDGDAVLVHLRMTGRLYIDSSRARVDPHEHVILTMEGGMDLRFHDTRKFGRWILTDDPEAILAKLGPEPLSATFTRQWLAERLDGRRRMIKPLLLDQTFIAGIGNIYVDEALWDAGVHPCRSAGSLNDKERLALHRSIRKVLRQGVRNSGTTLGRGETAFAAGKNREGANREHLKVFRRTGCPCPRCGRAIIRIRTALRGTHICTHCQPAPDG